MDDELELETAPARPEHMWTFGRETPTELMSGPVAAMQQALTELEGWEVIAEKRPDVWALHALEQMAVVRENIDLARRWISEWVVIEGHATANATAKAAGVTNKTVTAWAANPDSFIVDN